jgi:hypothetical protein
MGTPCGRKRFFASRTRMIRCPEDGSVVTVDGEVGVDAPLGRGVGVADVREESGLTSLSSADKNAKKRKRQLGDEHAWPRVDPLLDSFHVDMADNVARAYVSLTLTGSEIQSKTVQP